MSYAKRLAVVVTTAADGSATAYSDPIDYGLLSQIRYVKTDFTDGSTFTITSEATGETLWTETAVNASATRAPRQPMHGNEDGAVARYAAAGTFVRDKIAIVNDRIKIVIANGGNAKSGAFHFVLV